MKLGINLINFGPAARPEVLATWATVAETTGYHSLLTSDHVAVTNDVAERYPAPFFEPISLLGYLAGITERVQLGTTVCIVPYRHPLETARAFANLDQLCGGRMIFGVGVGWARQEFDVLGVPFTKRGRLTDEYLNIIIEHWRSDTISYRSSIGDNEQVDVPVWTTPPPRQETLPIWVGGSSEAALQRTVRVGGAWHPIRLRLSWLVEKGIPRLREAAEKANSPMPEICPRIQFRITDNAIPEHDRVMGEGSLDQLHGDLAALEDLGCAHVILDSFSGFDQRDEGRSGFESTLSHYEKVWDDYRMVAAEVFDLGEERVR